MSDPELEQAIALLKAGAYREGAELFRRQARKWTSQIDQGYMGKNLEAAEIAAMAWIGCIQAMLMLSDEEATAADRQLTRQYVDHLLDIGKLIKKRYEMKVRILYHAAQALQALGEEGEARKHLSAGNRFFDQQLARYAEPPYPDNEAVQLKKLRRELEDELLTKVQERTAKVIIEAGSTEELELAMEALRTGNGTWTVPTTYRERRTSRDSRAGARFTVTVKVTMKAALHRVSLPDVDLTDARAINAAIRDGVPVWFDGEMGWNRVAQAKMISGEVAVRAHRDDEWEFPESKHIRVGDPSND